MMIMCISFLNLLCAGCRSMGRHRIRYKRGEGFWNTESTSGDWRVCSSGWLQIWLSKDRKLWEHCCSPMESKTHNLHRNPAVEAIVFRDYLKLFWNRSTQMRKRISRMIGNIYCKWQKVFCARYWRSKMKNQITKETVYRIPADVKRESAVTLQESICFEITNILREDGKNYWFNAEISADSGRIQLYSFKHDERHRIIRVCGGRRDWGLRRFADTQ